MKHLIILAFRQLVKYLFSQAKQKLDSIGRAKESPVSSEDLIKYAHRVSASNAVCAPLNWQQGDPRRPYPTDIEMRNGFLGRIGEAGAVGWPPGASPALSSGGGGVPTAIQPSPKMQPPMGVPASAVGGAVASAGVSHHFFHCQPCTCVCSTGCYF